MELEQIVQVYAGEQIKTKQKLQSSPANQIYQINQNIIFKEFSSDQSRRREVAGACMLAINNPKGLPTLLGHGDRFIVQQFAQGMLPSKDLGERGRQIANSAVIQFMSSNMSQVDDDLYARAKLFPDISWSGHLKMLEASLSMFSEEITKRIGVGATNKIRQTLLAEVREQQDRVLVPTHRDLHLNNILVNPDTWAIKIIDFEHMLMAPIEYELQNAILWNDDCSVDHMQIFESLSSQGFEFDQDLIRSLGDLYFLDQLAQALMADDHRKIEVLLKLRIINQRVPCSYNSGLYNGCWIV